MMKLFISLLVTLGGPISHNWMSDQLGFWGGLAITTVWVTLGGLAFVTSPPFRDAVGSKFLGRRGRLGMYVVGGLIGAAIGVGLVHVAIKHSGKQPRPAPSRTVALRVADVLEEDQEHRVFTLSVWNDGDGLAVADANIIRLTGGEQTHESIVPLPVGWMFGKQRMGANDRARIALVHVDLEGGVLKVGNNSYLRFMKIHNLRGDVIGATVCVRVDFLGTPLSVVRGFQLVPDDTRPLLYRAEPFAQACPS